MAEARVQAESAEKGATTFRHYFQAYRVCCRAYGYADVPRLCDEQLGLSWFSSGSTKTRPSPVLKRHLFRGWLTLQTMEQLPLAEAAELATGASMWLPVQAYYASHGVGLATLHCTGQTLPGENRMTHSGFLARMSESIANNGYLVPPFDVYCRGDCTCGGEEFENTNVTPDGVRQLSNLSRPGTQAKAEAMVAKCLKAARAETLEKRFEQHKRRATPKRKRLWSHEKQGVVAKLHATTCMDFVYRMRIRSNYDDADLYLFGQQPDEALAYCRDVIWFARALCEQLSNVIQHRVGPASYALLQQEFRGARR